MKIYVVFLVLCGIACGHWSAWASPSASPAIVEPPVTPPPPTATQLNTPNTGDEDLTHSDNPNSTMTDTIPGPPAPTPFDEGLYPPIPPAESSLPTDTDPNALLPPPLTIDEPVSEEFIEAKKKEQEVQELIKYKAVRVRAEKDPPLQRIYQQAQVASTEEDYRAALRTYYRMLFKKIEDLDPSLTKKARGMCDAYLRKLAQMRIEPTIPLRPPPPAEY